MSIGSTPARLVLVTALALSILLAVAGCGKTTSQATARPTRNDAEATKLVTRWLEDVRQKDKVDLQEFLAPNFVQQRTTGTGITKENYIGNLPDFSSYTFTPVTGLQYGDTLTTSYQVRQNLIIDGKKYPKSPTPYLSTFVRIDGVWYLLSNGNFGVPKK